MITKALIMSRFENKFMVRIPLFESSGNLHEVIIPATLCYTPGNLDAYKDGDVVYVGFENNEISNPVILGKLYTGPEQAAQTYTFNDSLKTVSSAELPKKTSIGEFSPEEVYATFKSRQIFEDRITELEQKMNVLLGIVGQNVTNITDIIENSETSDEEIDDLFDDDPESNLNSTNYESTTQVDIINLYENTDEEYDQTEVQQAVAGTNYGLVDNTDIDNMYRNNYDIEEISPGGNPENNLNNTNYQSTSANDIAKLYEEGSSEEFDQSEVRSAVQGTDYGLVENEDIDTMYTDENKNQED